MNCDKIAFILAIKNIPLQNVKIFIYEPSYLNTFNFVIFFVIFIFYVQVFWVQITYLHVYVAAGALHEELSEGYRNRK